MPSLHAKAAPTVTAKDARQLLMGLQGLLCDPTRPPTLKSVRATIERMGFVQIDSISVVERAHHHILSSRFDGFRPQVLARLHERDRALFEHWTHDASLIPTAWFPQWRPRFERAFESAWWQRRLGPERERNAAHVLERIEREGPLMSKDFERAERGAAGGWWEWKPMKAALEYLWRTGRIAVSARVNFHKVYDLTERVLPEVASHPCPSREEHVDWACRTAADRLGVATPGEIAAFWGAITPAEASRWCREAVAQGSMVPVRVGACDGSVRKSLAVSDWEERLRRLSTPPDRIRLLSPFDPVLRDRRRAGRLFGFEYRFEAFVPEPKRRYGYYVLPLLEGDRLIGRLDPRLDRAKSVLHISKIWWEPGVERTRRRLSALEDGIARYAEFCGATRWTMPRRTQVFTG